MAESGSLTPVSEVEYETIEAAVMETARGRWFLSEFARRNRTADTTLLLDAISRLEQAVTSDRATLDMDRVRFDLMEMAKAIARTKSEIAAIHPADQEHSRLTAASESLDSIVRTTEQATSDILEAAEHIQEAAWTLREAAADETLCDELDQRATAIYTACSFQDLTAQRTSKIVNTLRYLEGRLDAMIEIWGGDEPGPDNVQLAAAPIQCELSQTDIDTVIVDEEPFPAAKPRNTDARPPREPRGSIIDEADDFDFIEAASLPPIDPPPTAGPEVDDADDFGFIEAAPDLPAPMGQPATPSPKLVDEAPFAEPLAADMANLAAFAEIESLDTREKLRRFT